MNDNKPSRIDENFSVNCNV